MLRENGLCASNIQQETIFYFPHYFSRALIPNIPRTVWFEKGCTAALQSFKRSGKRSNDIYMYFAELVRLKLRVSKIHSRSACEQSARVSAQYKEVVFERKLLRLCGKKSITNPNILRPNRLLDRSVSDSARVGLPRLETSTCWAKWLSMYLSPVWETDLKAPRHYMG